MHGSCQKQPDTSLLQLQSCSCRAAAELGHGLSSAKLSYALVPSRRVRTEHQQQHPHQKWDLSRMGSSSRHIHQTAAPGDGTQQNSRCADFSLQGHPNSCVSCPGVDKRDKSFSAASAGLTWVYLGSCNPNFTLFPHCRCCQERILPGVNLYLITCKKETQIERMIFLI